MWQNIIQNKDVESSNPCLQYALIRSIGRNDYMYYWYIDGKSIIVVKTKKKSSNTAKKSSNTANLILAKVLIRALKMHEKGVKQLEKKSKWSLHCR